MNDTYIKLILHSQILKKLQTSIKSHENQLLNQNSHEIKKFLFQVVADAKFWFEIWRKFSIGLFFLAKTAFIKTIEIGLLDFVGLKSIWNFFQTRFQFLCISQIERFDFSRLQIGDSDLSYHVPHLHQIMKSVPTPLKSKFRDLSNQNWFYTIKLSFYI